MGNTNISPYCCQYGPKDPHAQDFGGQAPKNQFQPNLRVSAADTRKIVKVQAVARGWMVRRNFRFDKKVDEIKLANSSMKKIPGKKLGQNKGNLGKNGPKELLKMPDYSNTFTTQTEMRLGPFVYSENDNMAINRNLITRGPIQLDNNAIYEGQWN